MDEREPAAQYTTTGGPRGDFGQAPGQLGERDVQGPGDDAFCALAGVAHVEQHRRPVPAERLAQVAGRQAARLVHPAGMARNAASGSLR